MPPLGCPDRSAEPGSSPAHDELDRGPWLSTQARAVVSLIMTAVLKHALTAWAAELGFDAIGVTHPDGIAHAAPRLHEFLTQGRHGDMAWMEKNADRRSSVLALWPECRSIIMLGENYAPASDPRDILDQPERGAISVYAQGPDYHDHIKFRLKTLASRFALKSGFEVKVFVDTAPLMEKPLAQASGLGWQGKHTNLVSRDHGSWLFLGAILTTAELPPDAPSTDHCGSCTRCLDICPTAAFPAPYQLDARRCIAYLTIEYRGHIPLEFRKPIANRVFGCDDCLAVCPWNKYAQAAHEARFAATPATDNPPLADLLALDDATFRRQFAGTPIKRTGRDRFIRNVAIAAGNSGDGSLVPLLEPLLTDASPLVRAMAIWATGELTPELDPTSLAHHQAREPDPAVRTEWSNLATRPAAKPT